MRTATFQPTTLGTLKDNDGLQVQQRPRLLNTERNTFLSQWINQMKTKDVIGSGGLSDWLSPLHLVPKRDKTHQIISGKFRVTADLSEVNKRLNHLPCLLPSAPSTAALFTPFKWKIVVDLQDGFYHIPLSIEHQQYFGAATPMGNIRFKRLPQGFRNSPSIMQYAMCSLIDQPLKGHFLHHQQHCEVATFVDDILGGTNDDPYALLAAILQQCIKANLTVIPSSIQLGEEATMLGKRLTKDGSLSIAHHHHDTITSLLTQLLAFKEHKN